MFDDLLLTKAISLARCEVMALIRACLIRACLIRACLIRAISL